MMTANLAAKRAQAPSALNIGAGSVDHMRNRASERKRMNDRYATDEEYRRRDSMGKFVKTTIN